jgi:hypothetical protein
MDRPVKQSSKKTYTKPVLKVYGTVRELTAANRAKGRRDGAGLRRHTGL